MTQADKQAPNSIPKPQEPTEGFAVPTFEVVIWWTMLITAVLAIPAIAILVSLSLPISDMGKTITFVVSCWVCTWLGMWLMRRSAQSK